MFTMFTTTKKFIMPIDWRQNLNEKQKPLTRPLLPYYSRAGTLQGLLLGRATQNVFGYRDIQGTDLIRVRRLHPGFVCTQTKQSLREETARS